MRRIILSGNRMRTREEAHRYLARSLAFPSYYGANLDALFDLLSTEDRETEILLVEGEALEVHLGDYGKRLKSTLEDAVRENRHLRLVKL